MPVEIVNVYADSKNNVAYLSGFDIRAGTHRPDHNRNSVVDFSLYLSDMPILLNGHFFECRFGGSQ